MYVTDRVTLIQIAEKVGVSRPTVSTILKDAGVTVGKKARKATGYESDILRLYVTEDNPVNEIAKLLSLSERALSELLRSNGVKIKRGGMRTIIHTELRLLELGESIELPMVGLKRRHTYLRFYSMARSASIRVSVRVIDESKVKVTLKA